MEVALGIAAIYAPVPSTYKYFGVVAETRPMREVKQGWGWMCLGGVMAALSAARGFRGGYGVLDGRDGFWIMAGSDRCDYGRLAGGLGEEWMIRDVEYKIHPSCGANHPAYWATRQLVDEHGVRPEDVAAVRITSFWADKLGDRSPGGAVDAQFSLPYTVAATIAREPLTAALYSDEKLRDPVIRRLLECTEVVHDQAADAAFFDEQRLRQSVELRLASGGLLRRDVEFPRDKPAYGRPEVEAKFELLAGRALDDARRGRARELIDRLETLGDVRALAAALA
jgi:2-methylcitrate dehydratase PrpD